MDEIEKLRRALGSAANEYNDAQLRQLSRELDIVAEFLVDLYMLGRNGKPWARDADFDTSGAEPVA